MIIQIEDLVMFDDTKCIVNSFSEQGGRGHVFLIKEKDRERKYALKNLYYYLENTDTYLYLINEWVLAQIYTM